MSECPQWGSLRRDAGAGRWGSLVHLGVDGWDGGYRGQHRLDTVPSGCWMLQEKGWPLGAQEQPEGVYTAGCQVLSQETFQPPQTEWPLITSLWLPPWARRQAQDKAQLFGRLCWLPAGRGSCWEGCRESEPGTTQGLDQETELEAAACAEVILSVLQHLSRFTGTESR